MKSPGRMLRDELKRHGMSQTDLADRMGRPLQAVNEITKDKKQITAETAVQLELTLGVPALEWLVVQAKYRVSLVRKEVTRAHKEITRQWRQWKFHSESPMAPPTPAQSPPASPS